MKKSPPLITEELILPEPVMAELRAQAKKRRISLSEYVSTLVKKYKPWPPVPPHVNERWDREIKEFEEEEIRNPRPTASTAEELMRLLDNE